MPRVHGLDTTQRRRHGGRPLPPPPSSLSTTTGGGGRFSLSTPFSNFSGRAVAPTTTTTAATTTDNISYPSAAMMMADDNLSFRGTQQSQEEEEEEVPGTQNPNFPTMASRMAQPPMMMIPTAAARAGVSGNAMMMAHQQDHQQAQADYAVRYSSIVSNLGCGRGSVNSSSSSGIATKITPRDKPPPFHEMETGKPSSSNRQYSPVARGALLGGGTSSSSSTASVTNAMTSTFAGAPSGGEEATTNVLSTNTSTSTAAAQSSNTTTSRSANTTANEKEQEKLASSLNSTQPDVTNDNNKLLENKYKDGMDDDDSSSSSSNDDDDEEQSVDLLNDISSNNNKKKDDSRPGRTHNTKNHSNNNTSSMMSLSPISPATQTLDRLSLIGSQDGGAELCVQLSANAVGDVGGSTTPMKVGDGRSVFADREVTAAIVEEATATEEETHKATTTAATTPATATAAAVSAKNNDGDRKTDTPSSNSAATALQASRTTTSSTLDIMKGIETGVDFLPGATLFAKYKGGGSLSRAQMIQKRGKGDDLEYYIQYVGLDKTEEACWVSVDQLYEINSHTKRLFRQYGVGEGGAKSFGKSDLNGRCDQQRHGEGSSTTTTTLTKQQCIRSLKEYFMSTQNSAAYAQNKHNSSSGGMELPLVTFCHNCNNRNRNNALSQVPHHSLCPRHEDFFVSGSYEILNLIVDGNLLGCTACMHHFRNGRPNKQLDHLENCKRYKPKGGRVGRKGQKAVGASSSGSVGGMSLTQFSQCDDTGAKRGSTADKAGEGKGGNNLDSRSSDDRQDSPELSDYEKLRLRNIQRNEARLAALGLLAPSSKKPASTKKSNKEGFLSRSDSKNDGESKKAKSKGKKKQPEAQKRTQPKRLKQKFGDEDGNQSRPASTNKETSGISNQKQRYDSGMRKDSGDAVAPAAKAKGKSIEAKPSLVTAAKSGCRKCTLEWQTDTKDPTKNHDPCCPRANSSRSTNTQQQLSKGSKKQSRTIPSQNNISPVVQKKEASQVTPRLLPAVHQGDRRTDAPPIIADTSINVSQADQSMAMDVDSNLVEYALRKGFSTAFLRGKTEEELLALLSGSRDSQQSVQTIIPPFIRDFIAEADRNNEIPAPRGTKWLSCPNPWGKIGHEEGDFVVISPFQSESTADMVSVFHQCPNGSIPKRFVANPLEEGSPYHDTHRSPARKGYSVLRLTRDRMGLRPWGFTVRLHEFGGACLVDSIEPLSPAEAAEDISGWTNKGAPVGLQLHDMIICVNGNSVGCMTEAELQLDLDLCRSEMMLVVARFDIEGNSNQDVTLEDLAMEWNDIGAGAPSRKKVVCFEEQESSDYRCDLNTQPKSSALTNTTVQNHFESHGGDDDDDASNTEESEDDDYTSFQVCLESRDDDASNAEESENDDDGPEGPEDTSSSNWRQKLTSELESKSDEELMRQLVDKVESGNWKRMKGSILAKILAKRGFLAAAKDESFQRLSCNFGGVTKEQVIEWMSTSETFQHYERIVRAKWSEKSFDKITIGTLKDVGYAKISGGGGRFFARYALPEEILSRELQCQNVMSQNYNDPDDVTSNAEESENDDNDPDGPEDTSSSNRTQRITSELESKSDEELMRQLVDTVESGNWNKLIDSVLAKILIKRGFHAAAKDESFQRLSCNSGGVTKDQVIEWMSRSETFQHYERTVRAKWTEKSFANYTTDAMRDLGYAKISGGRGGKGVARWALPEEILSRELQCQNVTSQNNRALESDKEDSDNRKQGRRIEDADVSEIEVNTDEELMEMLREGVKSGEWEAKAREFSRLARVLSKRACLAAARDEYIQQIHNESGGATKDQIIDWIDKSETFHGYKEALLTKLTEKSFENKIYDGLASARYTRFGSSSGTKWALPEDIVPRADINVKQSAVDDLSKSATNEKQNVSNEIFESKTSEELMEMLKGGVKSSEFPRLSKVLTQRACLAAARDKSIQQIHSKSGGVTKLQIIDWMDKSETFHGLKEAVLTKTQEVTFMISMGRVLKSTGYVGFGRGTNSRWALPEDIVPRVDSGKQNEIKNADCTTGKRKRESDTFAKQKKQFNLYSDESSQSSLEIESEEEEEEDDNPWLGCVCGRTHPPPIQVFWIQCGACDAWHNVAEACVGFSQEAADTIDEWICWSCSPPCVGLNL